MTARTRASTASASGMVFLRAKRLKLPAHHIEHDRARESGVAERLQHLVDGGNRAKARRLHGLVSCGSRTATPAVT